MSASVEVIADQETNQKQPASSHPLFDKVNQMLEQEYHLRIKLEFAPSVQIGIERLRIPQSKQQNTFSESIMKTQLQEDILNLV